MPNLDHLSLRLQEGLREYNDTNAVMDLVLFEVTDVNTFVRQSILTEAMLFRRTKLSNVLLASGPSIPTETILLAIEPKTLKYVLIALLSQHSVAISLSLVPVTLVNVTVSLRHSTMTVLHIAVPMTSIAYSIASPILLTIAVSLLTVFVNLAAIL